MKACPGSGKTLTVAARLHRLITNWKRPHAGIAAISFTNVAWQEIENYLANEYKVSVPIAYPHFIGTIDSFINRFIFLPYGHKIMGCSARPELTGPPHDDYEPIGRWLFWGNAECNKSSCKLNDFTYNKSGQLISIAPQSHYTKCRSGHKHCSAFKNIFNSCGYATQSDANYFAMKLLENIPELAKALAHRFPTLIVDEAQDSSSIQMRIIDTLIKAGMTEVMLAGDPYQAIYEWRQAEPQIFAQKYEDWKDNCVWLTESWRSTQNICDLSCRLANSPNSITAKNEEIAVFDHLPVLYGYGDVTELPQILETFRQHCLDKGIRPSNISVLTRSREFLNSIVPGTVASNTLYPWRDQDAVSRLIAFSKFLFDHGDFRGALAKFGAAAYIHNRPDSSHRKRDISEFGKSIGFGKWRGQLFRILCDLPESTGTISVWLPEANTVLSHHSIFRGCRVAIKSDRTPNIYSTLSFQEVFSIPATDVAIRNIQIGTIHSVKGRTLEAVFLALKSKGAKSRKYINLLGSDLSQEEELRIIYVGATRAQKALAIAVPQADLAQWSSILFSSSGNNS